MAHFRRVKFGFHTVWARVESW